MIEEFLKLESDLTSLHDEFLKKHKEVLQANEQLTQKAMTDHFEKKALRTQNEQLTELAIFARKIFIDRYVSWDDWSEWDKKYKEILPL